MIELQVKNCDFCDDGNGGCVYPYYGLDHTCTQNQLMELSSLVRFQKTLALMKTVWALTRTA